jgi:nucleoside-diphosphate-sugar epimerase
VLTSGAGATRGSCIGGSPFHGTWFWPCRVAGSACQRKSQQSSNIYGLSKVIGEELCRFYHRAHGLRCLILRPADFTPYRTRKQYGERLLRGGVDRRDVHHVTELAIENDTIAYDVFPVLREDPFTAEDVEAWSRDPAAVLERYVPGARDLVGRYTLDLPDAIGIPDISATKEKLGYRPRYNVITFLQELADRDAHGDAATWLEQESEVA